MRWWPCFFVNRPAEHRLSLGVAPTATDFHVFKKQWATPHWGVTFQLGCPVLPGLLLHFPWARGGCHRSASLSSQGARDTGHTAGGLLMCDLWPSHSLIWAHLWEPTDVDFPWCVRLLCHACTCAFSVVFL